MADLSLFSNEQIAALLAALPDPAFILTRSGRYAAIFGGTDSRYYHDGSSLVGKSIADVLGMTVDEGVAFFSAQPSVREKMLALQEVGLGYITIGQSATTLSGGEAQRI